MAIIQPSLPKGTRDFLPEEMRKRQYVIDTIRDIFERYGFEPLETPSIEKLKVLSGKYGDEGENLMFKILRRGTGLEDLRKGSKEFIVTEYGQLIEEALRYDLTVPLSRVIAMHKDKLIFPFKRYQIQPVWRADRPQKGRYREFYQCDVDVVGTKSLLVDAEMIALVDDVLSTLGFANFYIRINNRKLLNGILELIGLTQAESTPVFVAIDKLDKVGLGGVEKELARTELASASINKLMEVLSVKGNSEQIIDQLLSSYSKISSLKEGAEELQSTIGFLKQLGVAEDRTRVDLYLARGLGYYTGPIYESVIEEPKIGSLSGGGRYDGLIGLFSGQDVPAAGTSLGIERIIEVMSELRLFPDMSSKTQIMVSIFDEASREASIRLTKKLRNSGFRTESYPDVSKLKKQFTYADRRRIPFVAVIGPEEASEGKVTLKRLASGEQVTVPEDEAIPYLKKIFVKRKPS